MQYVDVDYHKDTIWKEGQQLLCSRSIYPSNPLDLPFSSTYTYHGMMMMMMMSNW
jgi:hypothetical protein